MTNCSTQWADADNWRNVRCVIEQDPLCCLMQITTSICEESPQPVSLHLSVHLLYSSFILLLKHEAWGGNGPTSSTDFLCLIKLNKQTLHIQKWMNWINKLTIKDKAISYCFTLFISGRPCHLSSFKHCSGTLFSSKNSLFIRWWKKININIVNMKILSLNFYFKTTLCLFYTNPIPIVKSISIVMSPQTL